MKLEVNAKFEIATAKMISNNQPCDYAKDDEAVFVGVHRLFVYHGYVVVRAEYCYCSFNDGETNYSEFYAIEKADFDKHFTWQENNVWTYHDQ